MGYLLKLTFFFLQQHEQSNLEIFSTGGLKQDGKLHLGEDGFGEENVCGAGKDCDLLKQQNLHVLEFSVD